MWTSTPTPRVYRTHTNTAGPYPVLCGTYSSRGVGLQRLDPQPTVHQLRLHSDHLTMSLPLLTSEYLPQHRQAVQLGHRVLHHDPTTRHHAVERLLLRRQRVAPTRLERDYHRHIRVVVLHPHIAFIHHRPLARG